MQLAISDSDERRARALLRALTFFSATILGDQIVRELKLAVAGEFAIESIQFEPADPLLVLGPHLATRMSEMWQSLQSADPPVAPVVMAKSRGAQSCDDTILLSRITSFLNDHRIYRPSLDDTPVEVRHSTWIQ